MANSVDPDQMHFVASDLQGGHWSEKSREKFIFLQGQGKVREFCKMVREILNTKKVRDKSGNFLILAQNCLFFCRFFIHLQLLKIL